MVNLNCFRKPDVDGNAEVLYDENDKPVVYPRRWLVLWAYTFGALMWNFEWARYGPITSEYAFYYNTTNEYNPAENELGVDMLTLVARFSNICSYPISGFLIDKFGLNMMIYGSLGQTVGCWLFFLAMDNFELVILARFITAIHGPLIYGSILRLTSHWFPATERVFAIAFAIFVSGIGGSMALLIPPLYKTGDVALNFELKSCEEDFIEETIELGLENSTDCIDDADDAFCCSAPTDIDGVNFLIAVLMTVSFVYTLLVVKDSPPTPPVVSGRVQSSMGFWKSLFHAFSYLNYTLMNVADFLASGVALVVYNTISRIFPSSVSDLAIYVTSGAMPLAIPVSFFFSWYIGKTGKYYELTAGCYYLGFLCWWTATAGLAIGGGGDYLVVFGATMASLLYLLWQVAVFEIKLEYIYTPDFALQGTVVAIDRTLINMASLTIVGAIPPERYEGPGISGRMFTFLVGGGIFTVAVLIIMFLPGKREYLRTKYEQEQAELEIKVTDEEKGDIEVLTEQEGKADVFVKETEEEGALKAVDTKVEVLADVMVEKEEIESKTSPVIKEEETLHVDDDVTAAQPGVSSGSQDTPETVNTSAEVKPEV